MIPFSRIIIEGTEKGFYGSGKNCTIEHFHNGYLFYLVKRPGETFSIGFNFKGTL
jgi:hypothetical protein